MSKRYAFGIGVACFALGALVQSVLAQANKVTYSPGPVPRKARGRGRGALLDGALQLAEDGSWERIAVGRAWYLGGDKAKGQQIFDGVTGSKKVEGSDWFRLGRVYAEAGEWDKAQTAFDRALAMDKNDDSGMIEYGALANVNKDRAKAEALFDQAFRRTPRVLALGRCRRLVSGRAAPVEGACSEHGEGGSQGERRLYSPSLDGLRQPAATKIPRNGRISALAPHLLRWTPVHCSCAGTLPSAGVS